MNRTVFYGTLILNSLRTEIPRFPIQSFSDSSSWISFSFTLQQDLNFTRSFSLQKVRTTSSVILIQLLEHGLPSLAQCRSDTRNQQGASKRDDIFLSINKHLCLRWKITAIVLVLLNHGTNNESFAFKLTALTVSPTEEETRPHLSIWPLTRNL